MIARLVLVCSIALALPGQERNTSLTFENIESLFRNRLPDERLAIEIRERGVDPPLLWREVQRLRELGIGPATSSALERFVEPSTLTIVVEPPLAGLPVSVASGGSGLPEPDRNGITDSSGRVTIDGLRPGMYRLNLKPPATHRYVEREIIVDSEQAVERITLVAAPAMLSVLTQDARVEIRLFGSYKSPFRGVEVPAGTYIISVHKPNHIAYSTQISLEPGEQRLLAPVLKREPARYPVVHRHNWARCWGTLLIFDDTIEYRQLGKHSAFSGSKLTGKDGKHSFEVPVTQILEVGEWSPNQLKIVLKDGSKWHFAHGVLKTATESDAISLEEFVDVRPIAPVIESIRRAQRVGQ